VFNSRSGAFGGVRAAVEKTLMFGALRSLANAP
jgi:hypothetical protein